MCSKGKGVPVLEGILQQETRVHCPTRWQTCITDPIWQSPSEAYLLVNSKIRFQISEVLWSHSKKSATWIYSEQHKSKQTFRSTNVYVILLSTSMSFYCILTFTFLSIWITYDPHCAVYQNHRYLPHRSQYFVRTSRRHIQGWRDQYA